MSLRNRISGLGALALVTILLVSIVGGAAAIGLDTETTTTSSTTEVNDGDTIAVNATSEGKHKIQVTGATADAAAHFKTDVDSDGEKEVVASFEGFEQVSDGTDHYKRNITEAEMRERLPLTADGEAQSFTVELVNDTTAESPATSTITVNTNASGFTGVDVGSDAVETEEAGFIGGLIGASNETTVSFEETGVPAGSGDVVHLDADSTDVSDEFTAFVSSDAAEGAIVPMQLSVNGELEDVYYQSAPEGASGTYGVLESDGDVMVHLSDDYDDSTVDVSASDDAIGIDEAWGMHGFSGVQKVISLALPF